MSLIDVEVIFCRHMLSCANAYSYYLPKWKQSRRLVYRDPELTNVGIESGQRVPIPKNVDFIMSSMMIRAQETALALYPDREIIVAPYIKEKGTASENSIESSPVEQAKRVGSSNINRSYVTIRGTKKKPTKWERNMAHVSNYNSFLVWLEHFIMGHKMTNPDPTKTKFKVFVVTHAHFIRSIYKSKEKMRNLAMFTKKYTLDLEHERKDDETTRLIDVSKPVKSFTKSNMFFIGVKIPEELGPEDVSRCKYKPIEKLKLRDKKRNLNKSK